MSVHHSSPAFALSLGRLCRPTHQITCDVVARLDELGRFLQLRWIEGEGKEGVGR